MLEKEKFVTSLLARGEVSNAKHQPTAYGFRLEHFIYVGCGLTC